MQTTIEDALKCINTSEFIFYICPDFVTTEQPEKQLYTSSHTPDFFFYCNFLKIENTKNYTAEETLK